MGAEEIHTTLLSDMRRQGGLFHWANPAKGEKVRIELAIDNIIEVYNHVLT